MVVNGQTAARASAAIAVRRCRRGQRSNSRRREREDNQEVESKTGRKAVRSHVNRHAVPANCGQSVHILCHHLVHRSDKISRSRPERKTRPSAATHKLLFHSACRPADLPPCFSASAPSKITLCQGCNSTVAFRSSLPQPTVDP